MASSIFRNFVNTFLFRLSELCVTYGHNALLLKVRNTFLRKIGVAIEAGAGIDRDFDFMMNAGQISIGACSIIGIRNHFWNYCPITIGKYCMFAADVTLANGGHDKNTLEPFSGPISIGNGCWVGTGAKIVGVNLNIGDNAIIGAGALVIEDVPPCAIVAGVPARVIGYRTLPEKVWHLGNTWFSPHTFEEVK